MVHCITQNKTYEEATDEAGVRTPPNKLMNNICINNENKTKTLN